MTQRTPLVSKVIFPVPNVSTHSVLHTKQVINLNQDPPPSRLATGFLRVYGGCKKTPRCFFSLRLSVLARQPLPAGSSQCQLHMLACPPPHTLYAGRGNLSQHGLSPPPFFVQHQHRIDAAWLRCRGVCSRRWMLLGPRGNTVTFTFEKMAAVRLGGRGAGGGRATHSRYHSSTSSSSSSSSTLTFPQGELGQNVKIGSSKSLQHLQELV